MIKKIFIINSTFLNFKYGWVGLESFIENYFNHIQGLKIP